MHHIKTFLLRTHSKFRQTILFLWTWVIPSFILSVLSVKVLDYTDVVVLYSNSIDYSWVALMVCILLLPINMILEAWKWKLLSQTFHFLPLIQALKAILSGRSLNVITPFGIGGTLTKIAWASKTNKSLAMGAEVIARVSQFAPTLLFGLSASFYLVMQGMVVSYYIYWAAFGLVALLFISWLTLLRHPTRMNQYFGFLMPENLGLIVRAFTLSFLRYIVFAFQFYLLFVWLNVELSSTTLLMGIAWVFIVKSVIPQVSILGDLVKRELSAIFFFQFFEVDLALIAIANVVIWGINIVLPALVGVFFVTELKEKL